MPPNYRKNGLCGACLRKAPAFRYCCAPYCYAHPLDRLIGAFKYHAKLQVPLLLRDGLLRSLTRFYRDKPWPQLLIPVPLHRSRILHRGFNQSAIVADMLGRELHIPVAHNSCRRCLKTPNQKGLTAGQRRRNLRQAFTLGKENRLKKTPVAIVDDVVTTMSTGSELARLLLQSGAGEVHLWAMARTLRERV